MILLTFDVHFSQSTEHKKHIQILDVLKSFIDPFDYDVYIPHLNKMLNRQLQRSNVKSILLSHVNYELV